MSQDERKGRGGRPSGPKHGGDRVDAAFDRWLSRQLNQMYGDVLNEPIPQSMLDLLTEAERRTSNGNGGGPEDGGSGDDSQDVASVDHSKSGGPPPGTRWQSVPQEQQMQAQAASSDVEPDVVEPDAPNPVVEEPDAPAPDVTEPDLDDEQPDPGPRPGQKG